ncbi:MAG: SDR family NAD(P)-dependent oxidoreductase [Porticoccaceae bacterium]
MSLQGKVVLITGAAQGFGQVIALSCARSGATIVACDLDSCEATVKAVEAEGGKALALSFDVTDYGACEAAVGQAIDVFGRIDALVNNGALYGSLHIAPFEQIDPDEWDLVMKVNVKGVWHMCKAVTPHMRAAKNGSIVNISSNSALIGPPMICHYVTSKAALFGLTRTLATELGPDNIRINAVCPGAMNTAGSHRIAGDMLKDMVEASPARLKTFLEPEDVVGTVKFLISDHSAIMTGQTLAADGGIAML